MNYFIEGLQGSGKSTMLQKMAQMHPDHQVLREGNYNPVELAWCAYMTELQYREMLEKFPELRSEIGKMTFSENDRRIVCYTRVQTDNGMFCKEFEQYEIYNGRVSFDDFKRIILTRFQNWNDEENIFECSMFQNIIEDMILFRCCSDEDIINFYKDIRQVLTGKNIRIIYLKSEDIKNNIEIIRKERSDENGNELWFPMFCGFFNDSPYAKAKGVKDEKGIFAHLAHRQDLELKLCREVFADCSKVLTSKKYTDADLETL